MSALSASPLPSSSSSSPWWPWSSVRTTWSSASSPVGEGGRGEAGGQVVPGGCGHPAYGGGSLPAGLAGVSSNLESILKQRGWEWT